MEQNNRKVGALWIKEKNGKSFMAGEIVVNGDKHKVVAFKNTNKKNPKQPDWDILKSIPNQGLTTGQPSGVSPFGAEEQ